MPTVRDVRNRNIELFTEMTKQLIIIPCGQSKVWDKSPKQGVTEAKDVYVGSPFKMNRRYAESLRVNERVRGSLCVHLDHSITSLRIDRSIEVAPVSIT